MASKEILDKLCEAYYLGSLPIQKHRQVKMSKFGIETHEFFLPAEVSFKFTDGVGKPDAKKTKEVQDKSREMTSTDILTICWNTLLGEHLLDKFKAENPRLTSEPLETLRTPDEKMAFAERVMVFLGIGPWAVQQLESLENKDGVAIGMKRLKGG